MAERTVALLVDAENVSASLAAVILKEASRYGALIARRVYGDFSRPSLAPWLEAAPRHALTSCQTVSSAAGKNAADIALVIDAVEMLYESDAEVFCLATSDSDFTQLAMRIRQSGKTVVGFGSARASGNFRTACDVFKVVEAAKILAPSAITSPPASNAKKEVSSDRLPTQRRLEADILKRAFVATPPLDGGWVGLPDIMKSLRSHEPKFSIKTYGHNQFYKLLAFSGVELGHKNQKARLKVPALKKVVDNG